MVRSKADTSTEKENRNLGNGRVQDPTPEEIRRGCEEVQAEWSKADWGRRKVQDALPVQVRIMRTPTVFH